MSADVKCSCLLNKFLPSELEVTKCERISQVMVAQAEQHFIIIGGAGSWMFRTIRDILPSSVFLRFYVCSYLELQMLPGKSLLCCQLACRVN